MKTRPPYTFLALAVALLLGGLLLGRAFVAPSPLSPADGGFRQLFWSERALDLMAQVALVFAGVLGVLALLREGEVTESEGDWYITAGRMNEGGLGWSSGCAGLPWPW